jgi:serine/threonine protein phosphatase PrpC
LAALPNLKFLEYLGNKTGPAGPPPLSFHILDNSTSSFPTRFGVGYSGTLGDRPTMEDCVLFQNYNDHDFLCGIFDGHTGHIASTTASHCLMHEVSKILPLRTADIGPEFANCFTAVNDKLRLLDVADGCTAAVAFFKNQRCFTAGVGDSRIVRVKEKSFERVTVDCKPTVRSEFERLRDRGIIVNTEGRICRKLAVARSLGDFWCDGGVYVEPDVAEFEIEADDVALIVACDGLWDVIEDEWASVIVRKAETAADAAVSLRNFALALGSKDNVSVVVIRFHVSEDEAGLCPRNTVELLPIVVDEEPEDDGEFAAMPPVGRRRS